MDIKVFVDTDADLRFTRRLGHDMRERGRTLQSVAQQYLATVRPMHMEFIELSKRYADVIIPEGGYNDVGIDLVIQKLRSSESAHRRGVPAVEPKPLASCTRSS